MSNEKKIATLGMPYGTATGRLRKMLLFRQLRKCGDDVCVRCGERIELIEQLSIEHIKPWEGVSADLFWDLDNIAFAHLECNLKESNDRNPRKGPVPKPAPEGTAWCSGHKAFLSVIEFYENKHKHNGYRDCCKVCWSEQRKNHKGR